MYRNKFYNDEGQGANEINEREAASSFVKMLEKSPEYLPELLNGFYMACPQEEALWDYIQNIQRNKNNSRAITIKSPYDDAVPLFIKEWINLCKNHPQLSDLIGVEDKDLNRFMDKMKKYFTRSEFIDPILEDFNNYFPSANYSSVQIIRNYLLWILGEKLYYLEHKEQNDESIPIVIPENIDFNSFVLDIWRDQLPNIYVNNYQMKQATEGIELLQTIE